MKNKLRSKEPLKKRIIDALALPREIVSNLPLITIVGKEELSIENYKSVIEYTNERIRINTPCGVIKIEGAKLILKQITNENILVLGTIRNIEYLM